MKHLGAILLARECDQDRTEAMYTQIPISKVVQHTLKIHAKE